VLNAIKYMVLVTNVNQRYFLFKSLKLLKYNSPWSFMFKRLLSFVIAILFLQSCTLLHLNDEPELSPEERESLSEEANNLRKKGRKMRETVDFANALQCQTRALEISLLLNDSLCIIQDFNQLGTTFRRIGRLERAINYHLQALSYAESISDTSATAVKSLVVSLNGLGNAYLTLGDNEQAERCFRRALKGESQLQSHLGMAINYANLGSIKDRYSDLDSARWYYNKSLEENIAANSTMGQGLCHVYLGNNLERRNQLKDAEAEFLEARKLLLDDQDRWHAVEPTLALGENLLLQGRVKEALVYAEEALQCANEMNSIEILKSAYDLQARLQEKQGNLREALNLYKEARAWTDSLNASDNDHSIRNAIIGHEIAQHESEMNQLQEAIAEKEYKNDIIFWVELGLLIAFVIVAGLLWYASESRKARIKALDKLDSMRTSFLRNITHEFRTPLTVILGLSNQLKDDQLDKPKRLHYLGCIEQQGRNLLELVNELLGLSKLMSGYGQCKWCHGDVVAFLRMSMAGYSDFARMRNVQLSLVNDQETIDMDFVPEFYGKILNNLLGNAFKYTPAECSIIVHVAKSDDQLSLRISDTGTGISPEDLPHIFELFYQGKESAMQGSTGVGLPFVKQMVQHMGGTIVVVPNEPRGTEVQIALPIRCNADSADIEPWSIEKALEKDLVSPSNIPVQNATTSKCMEVDQEDDSLPLVLVVEDNPDVAEYIQLVLKTHYRVLHATDGYDALNKVGNVLPDAIVTDLMMPGMDGYQLCQSIRQSQVLADVPIVILSARSEDADRVRGYEDGADAYLLKPFNPNELMALLARLLTQRRQMRNYVRQIISNSQAITSEKPSEEKLAQDHAFLQKLHSVVARQMIAGDLQVETISNLLNMSKSTFSRQVKQIAGCSASAYILQLRLDHARQLLVNPEKTIGEISLDCGFDDMSYFWGHLQNPVFTNSLT